jgi:hypothetical protein
MKQHFARINVVRLNVVRLNEVRLHVHCAMLNGIFDSSQTFDEANHDSR